MSAERKIIEDFSPDNETPKILADLSEIFNDTQQKLTSLPHMRLTQERLNKQPVDQPWRQYSGLGMKFPR